MEHDAGDVAQAPRRKIIFIHQNAPGQFRHLIRHCAESAGTDVAVIGERQRLVANLSSLPVGIGLHVYDIEAVPVDSVPLELGPTANAMRRGRAVAMCLENLRLEGFFPDVIYGHPGWGEMLHVKDVFPDARIAYYCEFYFNRDGQDLDFDREFQAPRIDPYRVRTDNMTQIIGLVDADVCISPTQWQRSRYPARLRQQIEVIHDGIDLTRVVPDEGVTLVLPGTDRILDRSTPVITYVSRNLEPYRGFHVFMRALPALLAAVPYAHVLILGGDEVSYGSQLSGGQTYRMLMLDEVGQLIDPDRVHFLGRVPYPVFLKVLQLSSAHVYLTYPFVLSWSLLEAMAVGAPIVGSRTAPVEEVVADGENGRLVDFFDQEALVSAVASACAGGATIERMRRAATDTVRRQFALSPGCLERQLELLFAHVPEVAAL